MHKTRAKTTAIQRTDIDLCTGSVKQQNMISVLSAVQRESFLETQRTRITVPSLVLVKNSHCNFLQWKRRNRRITFCCSSASRFCCTMTTRYSSHCFWNWATFVFASSSSTDIFSTFSRVSSILKRPFFSLFAASPNSFRFSYRSLSISEWKGLYFTQVIYWTMPLKWGNGLWTRFFMLQNKRHATLLFATEKKIKRNPTLKPCIIHLFLLFVSNNEFEVVGRSDVILSFHFIPHSPRTQLDWLVHHGKDFR